MGWIGKSLRKLAAIPRRHSEKPAPSLEELKRSTPGLHRLIPDRAEYLLVLAANLFASGHERQANECLDQAESLGCDAETAAVLRARNHSFRGEYSQGLQALEDVLSKECESVAAYEAAAILNFNSGNLERAVYYYREAVRLNPQSAIMRGSFAGTLYDYGRYEEAITEAKRALRYDPRAHVALKNLAVACGEIFRLDEEEGTLRRALQYYPDDPDFSFILGLCRLRRSDFAEGWRLYERRLDVKDSRSKIRESLFARPRWEGGEFRNKTLLVYGEQGMGDNIMMARFFSETKALGGKVALEVAPALTGLLGSVPGVDQVVPLDLSKEPEVEYDIWVPSMSLPYVLRVDPKLRQAPVRYLAPDPESVKYWHERTGSPSEKKIGIAWSGNPIFRADHVRSIPLDQIRSLVGFPGAVFFSLQLSPGWTRDSPKPVALLDFTDELFTFGDTAGLIECMDLVISVDTSVAHLAGALGKETWLLTAYRSEWRWGLRAENSAWYPSVKIMRQPAPRDWRALMMQVESQLGAWVASHDTKDAK